MALDQAREFPGVQVPRAGGYKRNAARLILAEVAKEHGQLAVDRLIRDFGLEQSCGFEPGVSLVPKAQPRQGVGGVYRGRRGADSVGHHSSSSGG